MDSELKQQLDYIDANTILMTKHGSQAYGTNTATSDLDIKGVCILPDKKLYYGMQTFEQQDKGWTDSQGNKQDKVIFDIRKFCQLASNTNPNIIEILHTDDGDLLKLTESGKKLRESRNIFLSKKARYTFSGYAISQLQRMKAHKRWLDNPASKPNQADFLHKKTITVGPSGSALGASTKILKVKASNEGWFELDVEVFDKSAYEHAKNEYEHYTTWRKNRNPQRAEIESKHKLDCKAAMHLVRLLRMGFEILTTGKVLVRRPDNLELLAIRNGAWSYEQILQYASDMDQNLESAYAGSSLPDSVDLKAVEKLQMDLIECAL